MVGLQRYRATLEKRNFIEQIKAPILLEAVFRCLITLRIEGHVQKYGGSFDQNSKILKMAKNRIFATFSSIFKKSTPNFKQSFSPLILIYYHIEKIKKCLHNTFMIKN